MAKWDREAPVAAQQKQEEEVVPVEPEKNPCIPDMSPAEMRNRITVYPPEPGAEVAGVPHSEAEAQALEQEVKAEDPSLLK
jgi:hypothetical protein